LGLQRSARLPGKKNETEPVVVELRVNGKFGKIPAQVANIPRANLPKANPKIPDPAHGFQYTILSAALLKGVQKIVLFGKVGEDGVLNPLGGSPKQPAQEVPLRRHGVPLLLARFGGGGGGWIRKGVRNAFSRRISGWKTHLKGRTWASVGPFFLHLPVRGKNRSTSSLQVAP
jgi:hypothetical protein